MVDEVKISEIVSAIIATSKIVKSSCYLNKLLIAEELLRKYIADNYNLRLNILTFDDEIKFKFEDINKG